MRELWQLVLEELMYDYSRKQWLSGAIMRITINGEVVRYSLNGSYKNEKDRLKQATNWVETISRKHQRQYTECVFAMDIDGEMRLDYHNAGNRYGMILGIPKNGDGSFRIEDIIGKDEDVDIDCLANLNYRLE
jgi:hypothetical protein